MPVTWGFDRNGVATVTLTPPYSLGALRRAMDGLLAAPRVLPLRLLVDRRSADSLDTSTFARVLGCLQRRSAGLAGASAALVVNHDAAPRISQLLERQAPLARVPITLKVFGDYQAAATWLASLDFA
jgi:hypothetical protein